MRIDQDYKVEDMQEDLEQLARETEVFKTLCLILSAVIVALMLAWRWIG